jgi:hypothetical protein
MESSDSSTLNDSKLPALLYFFGRLVTFLALIPDSYMGPGDLPRYIEWVGLPGWPYVHYWVEFPPLFPLLNAGLYKLTGAQTFQYTLLLALVLALAGAFSLYLFRRIATRTLGGPEARQRTWVYLALLLPLPYTWWYFDLLPLVFLLLGTLWLIEGRAWRSGLATGMGMLFKWFPGLLLASALRFRKPGVAGKVIAGAVGLVIVVLGLLYLLSPEMTLASVRAQPSRSSWQTVWALIDGNMTTGAFLLPEDRLDPSIAGVPRGAPARVPSYLSLVAFGALGAWLFWRVRSQTPRALVAFLGLTWLVFLTWSPGWSPQWILYLIPLILLTLPFKSALYGSGGLILIALLEWPTLLAHAAFEGLWLIVPLRLALFAWLGWCWYRQTREA